MQQSAHLEAILSAEPDERHNKPVTSVKLPDGREVILSRYGDLRIDLSPYLPSPNGPRYINVERFPSPWRTSMLDLLLTYWRHGYPGQPPPVASTVISRSIHLTRFAKWANSRGLRRFADVRPIHVQQFAEHLRSSTYGKSKRRRTPDGIATVLNALQLPWALREYLQDAMQTAPLGDETSVARLAGQVFGAQRTLVTQPLRIEDARSLFTMCQQLIDDAGPALQVLEAVGEFRAALPVGMTQKQIAWLVEQRFGTTTRKLRTQVTTARVAAACLIALLAGLRIHEILLLDAGCFVETEQDGQTLCWIRGRTLKTRAHGDDRASWIAPPMLRGVVDFLERASRWSRPSLARDLERAALELERDDIDAQRRAHVAKLLHSGTTQQKRLFLTHKKRRKKGSPASDFMLTRHTIVQGIVAIAKRAGLPDVKVLPHELRRTYAMLIVHQCAGDLRYLRVQFQHWTLETTQLYARHEGRDQELVDEIASAMLEYKTGLVAAWLNPEVSLGGRGGEYIKRQRAELHFSATLRHDQADLARSIAPGLIVRPTGHSWCVSTGEPTCGGAGLYDATQCSECDSAVVQEKHRSVWELLAVQLIEARGLGDGGPGAQQLIERSLNAIDAILRPLGTSVPEVTASHVSATS